MFEILIVVTGFALYFLSAPFFREDRPIIIGMMLIFIGCVMMSIGINSFFLK